jgi:hypothetical protein
MFLIVGALSLALLHNGADGLQIVLRAPAGMKAAATRTAPAKAAPAKPADTNGGGAKPLRYMDLQEQFAGPLKDTIIQRWRDPHTNTTCYVYLPVIVQHSPPLPNGMVQYGANNIGSISCFPAR